MVVLLLGSGGSKFVWRQPWKERREGQGGGNDRGCTDQAAKDGLAPPKPAQGSTFRPITYHGRTVTSMFFFADKELCVTMFLRDETPARQRSFQNWSVLIASAYALLPGSARRQCVWISKPQTRLTMNHNFRLQHTALPLEAQPDAASAWHSAVGLLTRSLRWVPTCSFSKSAHLPITFCGFPKSSVDMEDEDWERRDIWSPYSFMDLTLSG